MIRFFVVVVFLLSNAACSTLVYKPLLVEHNLDKVESINVIHIVNQKNIEVQFSPFQKIGLTTGLMAGGVGYVVGAVVDAAMEVRSAIASRKEQRRVAPFKDMLNGYDAEKKGAEVIRKAFGESEYSIGEYLTLYDVKPKMLDINKYVNDFSREKLLTIKTEYSFDTDLNSVQVSSTGVLYLEPPKESRSSPKKGRWKTIVWNVHYQSPRRQLKYKAVEEHNMEIEKNKLEKYYDGLIRSASPSKKQSLKIVKKMALDKFKRRKYVKYTPPLIRPGWDGNLLKGELDKGISLSIQELIRSLDNEEIRVKGEYEVVYMLPDVKGTPRNKISLAVLDRDVGGEHLICWASSNQKYIIPNQELLQLPSPYRR